MQFSVAPAIRAADQILFHEHDHPSALILPVTPLG